MSISCELGLGGLLLVKYQPYYIASLPVIKTSKRFSLLSTGLSGIGVSRAEGLQKLGLSVCYLTCVTVLVFVCLFFFFKTARMTLNFDPFPLPPSAGISGMIYLVLGTKPRIFVYHVLLKFRGNLCLNPLHPIHCAWPLWFSVLLTKTPLPTWRPGFTL